MDLEVNETSTNFIICYGRQDPAKRKKSNLSSLNHMLGADNNTVVTKHVKSRLDMNLGHQQTGTCLGGLFKNFLLIQIQSKSLPPASSDEHLPFANANRYLIRHLRNPIVTRSFPVSRPFIIRTTPDCDHYSMNPIHPLIMVPPD